MSVSYIEDGLLVGKAGPVVFVRLGLYPDEFLGHKEWDDGVRAETRRLVAIQGYDCQLLGIQRQFGADDWEVEINAITPNPNWGFAETVATAEEQIRKLDTPLYECYLGVYLKKPKEATAKSLWASLRESAHTFDRVIGTDDPRPSEKALETWRHEASRILDHLRVGGRRCELASASDLRYLIRRSYWRGLGMPVIREPTRKSWGGSVSELLAGAHIENGYNHLRIERSDGQEAYVATLVYSDFPEEMPEADKGWASFYREIDFPIDLECRFRVLEQSEATKAIKKLSQRAMDQWRHVMEVPGAQAPEDLQVKIDIAAALLRAVQRREESIVYLWGRLMVAASSLEELPRRIKEIKDKALDEMNIVMEVASGDQVSLFSEFLPGSEFPELSQKSYRQEVPVRTLAAGQYDTAMELGDRSGPYIGVTRQRTPVFFDVHYGSRFNGPTMIAVVGLPGYGKTATTGLLGGFWEQVRGHSVLSVEPDGANDGLIRLFDSLGFKTNPIDLGLNATSLSLDPFVIAKQGEAGSLAATMLQALLPYGSSGDIETAILVACAEVDQLHREGKEARLEMVAQKMKANDRRDEIQQAARALEAMAQFAPALFSNRERIDKRLDLLNAYTVLRFQGLQIPDREIPRSEYTTPHRIANATMAGMVGVAGQMIELGGRAHPKTVIYDDSLTFLQNPAGRAVISRDERRGRKFNCTPIVISHVPQDYVQGDTNLLDNIGAAMVFRVKDEATARACCILLGIPQTEENLSMLQDLGEARVKDEVPKSVQCALRDFKGTVGLLAPDQMTDEIHQAFLDTPTNIREAA